MTASEAHPATLATTPADGLLAPDAVDDSVIYLATFAFANLALALTAARAHDRMQAADLVIA